MKISLNPFPFLARTIDTLAVKWGKKTPRSKSAQIGYWLLLELMVLIPEAIFSLPLIVAATAWQLNRTGVATGDADGMTASFPWLFAAAALLALVAVGLMQWWIVAAIRKNLNQ